MCIYVNFQYLHNQVPTAYFSMMFNIHKHISAFFLLKRQHFYLKKFQVLLPPKICVLYKSLLPRTTTKITNFILDEIQPGTNGIF
jgi:hypothetical protein